MKIIDQNENRKSSTRPAFLFAARQLECGLLGALLLAGFLAAQTQAEVPGVGGKRSVDVMQVNLYIGADLHPLVALNPADPNYLTKLVSAVTEVYYEVVASQPGVRLGGVADAIVVRMPDIITVEEATLLRNQSPGDLILGGSSPATNVVYDYVQILADALAARGAHYIVASTSDEWDVELPMMNLQTGGIDDVRQTDREAILVRADLPPGQFRVSHPQNGHFTNVIAFPSMGLSFKRGWCSTDVSIRGRDFRCICVHLEEETAPQIQALQIQELLAGPVNTSLPVMVVGDFNTDPLGRDGSFAYSLLPAAGFGDAWAVLHPDDPMGGLSWGHDQFLADPGVSFDRRIDLMFYRGSGFQPIESDVADLWLDCNQAPLWASDHAALTAEFGLR